MCIRDKSFLHPFITKFIIKLVDVLIIYLVSTCEHGFMFKTYTPLSIG